MRIKMDLSPDEVALIESRRKVAVFRSMKADAERLIADAGAKWATYSESTGMGLSFSEFCNCCDCFLPKQYRGSRKELFEAVKSMIAATEQYADRIAQETINGDGE